MNATRRSWASSPPPSPAESTTTPPLRRPRAPSRRGPCAISAMALFVLWSYSIDGWLNARHMSFRQRAGDAYWVAASTAQQWRTPAFKGKTLVNASAARDCKPQRPKLLMHLKVPKAASTTVFDVLYALAAANHFAVNSRPFYVDRAQPRRSAKEYARYLASLAAPTARTAHGAYIDVGGLGLPRPAYVALVRDPVRRLVSHYDYIHWGPRSAWATFWKGQDRNAPDFYTCVADHSFRRNDDHGDCLYWANAQLAYFCGLSPACQPLEITYGTTGPAALQRALDHVDRDFVVVGLVEDLDHAFIVLERVLPSFFAGARRKATGLVSRANTHVSHHRRRRQLHTYNASVLDDRLRRSVLRWECLLYDRLAAAFRRQLAACS